MKSIFERGDTYEAQLKLIKIILLAYASKIGWEPTFYGRRPRIGIFGKAANMYLYWSTSFAELESVTPQFLEAVSDMHTEALKRVIKNQLEHS